LAVKPITRPLARMDVRNHRKLAVVDGLVAMTGSHNITDESYGQKRVGPWRDLSITVRGAAVHELQMVFCEDWLFETGREVDRVGAFPDVVRGGDAVLQAVPSGPGYRTEAFRDLMVAAVHEANERVVVTTPYFVPDSAFLLALRLAAMGGLEVHVVVPEKGNHPLVHAAGCATYDALLRAGVRIHLHTQGLLHAKTITIDHAFGVIGSGNFDMRSFSLNFELSMLVFGATDTDRLRRVQEGYMGESRELDATEWAERGAIRAVWQDSANLLGPLL
jgi:cardiolipin synthase